MDLTKKKLAQSKIINRYEFLKIEDYVKKAIQKFLEKKLEESYNTKHHNYFGINSQEISDRIVHNIKTWMCDEVPSKYQKQILIEIKKKKWESIAEAFWENLGFGSGGIRGKLIVSTNDYKSEKLLKKLFKKGFTSQILQGSNTFNEITVMKLTTGLVKYMKKHEMTRVVIGYDSRIGNKLFSELVARIFLANNFVVYLFDEVTPLPLLAFAVTHLKADIGIEITASHNDKRYNGYKILKGGFPLNINERNEISNAIFGNRLKKIPPITMKDVKLIPLQKAKKGKLVLLLSKDDKGTSSSQKFINIYDKYASQLQRWISRPDIVRKYSSKVRIGFSALNGTGYQLVTQVLNKYGFTAIQSIAVMKNPDPLFSLFHSTQMLDPGEKEVTELIVKEFTKEYGKKSLENLDILIAIDPDADRLSLLIKVPRDESKFFGKWRLVKGDDLWSLVLWYRLKNSQLHNGKLKNKLFIVKNYVTTDCLKAIAKKYKLKCENTWVGFGELANVVRKKWKKGFINVGMFEESNGFNIGDIPQTNFNKRFVHNKILEKDGVLAALLISEIAAYCKQNNTSIWNLLDQLYLERGIGFFATHRSQIPIRGTFEGLEGEITKLRIIKGIEELVNEINEKKTKLILEQIPISRAEKYSTGKYDFKYWKNYPDEGFRFFLDKKTNQITIRPSGTESKIRVFVQYKMVGVNQKNLLETKFRGEKLVNKISKDIIKKIQLRTNFKF